MIAILVFAVLNLLVMIFGKKDIKARQVPLFTFGEAGMLVYQIAWGNTIDEYMPVERSKRHIYGHNLGLYLPNGFCVIGISISRQHQMIIFANTEFGLWQDEEHRR